MNNYPEGYIFKKNNYIYYKGTCYYYYNYEEYEMLIRWVFMAEWLAQNRMMKWI